MAHSLAFACWQDPVLIKNREGSRGLRPRCYGHETRSMIEQFRPAPFLGNRHVQTLLGHFWKGSLPPLHARERHVLLPDGDRLVLHDCLPDTWQPGGLIALLVPAL